MSSVEEGRAKRSDNSDNRDVGARTTTATRSTACSSSQAESTTGTLTSTSTDPDHEAQTNLTTATAPVLLRTPSMRLREKLNGSGTSVRIVGATSCGTSNVEDRSDVQPRAGTSSTSRSASTCTAPTKIVSRGKGAPELVPPTDRTMSGERSGDDSSGVGKRNKSPPILSHSTSSNASRPGAFRVGGRDDGRSTSSISCSPADEVVDEEEAVAVSTRDDEQADAALHDSLTAFAATSPTEAVPYTPSDTDNSKSFPSMWKRHFPHFIIEAALIVAVVVLAVLLSQTEEETMKGRVMISTNTSNLCWSSQARDGTRIVLAECDRQDEGQAFLIASIGEWLGTKGADIGMSELAQRITIQPSCGGQGCDGLSVYAKGFESASNRNRTAGYIQGELFATYGFPHIFWALPLGDNLYSLGGRGETECTYEFDCLFVTNYYTEPIVRLKEDSKILTLRTKKAIDDAATAASYIVHGSWRIVFI